MEVTVNGIRAAITRGDYESKVPYGSYGTPEGKLYREEIARQEEQFKQHLFEAFGVTEHPKAQKVFDLAWEHGHDSGWLEVLNYFIDFVELIKD